MRTIRKITIPLAVIASVLCFSAAKENKPSYPISNVPFTSVKVSPETFWGDRIRQSREVTIPLAFSKCEETDRYTNFEHAAAKMAETARGKIAVERGPLVYCAEWADNDFNVLSTALPVNSTFQVVPTKLPVEGRDYEMNALETSAFDNYTGNTERAREVKLRLIPYYAWAHRGNGNMEVWMTRK
ncbi:MAG: hypothetical protein IKX55_07570 [Bacteroidaceae bacterium]|nr:hypothetical protein [Bacteroidaceae bacterium]